MNIILLASLVSALVQVESGGRNVIAFDDGHTPSYGCAQIKMRTAKAIDPKMHASDLMNCDKSKVLASKYLLSHYIRYGNWHTALCRYNTGKPLKDCIYARKVIKQWLSTPAP